MKIRLATRDDAVILAELVRDVQRIHADALPYLFKQPGDSQPFVEDFQERILTDDDGYTFIAELDGEAAGYVYVEVIQRPETPYTYARLLAYIDQISVRPAYQGKGCGRALIEAVFDLARSKGIDQVLLDTWAFNTEAHEFFGRMGFEFYTHRMHTHLVDKQTEKV